MKKFLATFSMVALLVAFASAQAAQTAPTEATKSIGGPVMTFEKMEIDYGTIAQGADPLRKFKFKNTGTEPLVIKNARGSCGCTVPSYKKEPIMPGETSEIEVRYDTQRPGPINKQVTIETNEGDMPRVLTIRGNVNEKAPEPSVPTNAPSILSTPKQ
jgi:hypothetical protein